MKQFLALIAAFGFSVAASAGQFTTDTDGTGASTDITSGSSGTCTLLSEDVTVTTSAYTEGGYNCNTTNNVIAVATCHPNGREDSNGNNYFYIGDTSGGTVGPQDPVDSDCGAATAESKATTASGAGS